ncbi:MAG: adenylosuccinate lyase [Myxococcota bacterium]|nr:adenylosuccinate lyase [Myxococcota bacterium]
MIPRYRVPELEALWSTRHRYEVWFDVELAACAAMERAGLVPPGTASALVPLRERIDPDAIERLEQVGRHDVIAFLTHLEQLGGEPARWLHRGLTSSDVVDTALAILLRDAADALLGRLQTLGEVLAGLVETHRRTPVIGRTHGMHAEPLRFGQVLAGHLAELTRARRRLREARAVVAVGKLAGAVGTYAHLSPDVEADALGTLGLRPETVPTQVVARDRHAEFFVALALLAAAIERLATNLRHGQRSEVGELEEPFGRGQKGSSAMPHKRNPVLAENLCGLARLVRAAVAPALENIVLWHERDISHSSVERVLAPDVTTLVAFMLERATQILRGLTVRADRMAANLERTGGLWASEGVLLALVEAGMGRQQAYELVQRAALECFEGRGAFVDRLLAEPAVAARIDRDALRDAVDLDRALRHGDRVIDRALAAFRESEGSAS